LHTHVSVKYQDCYMMLSKHHAGSWYDNVAEEGELVFNTKLAVVHEGATVIVTRIA
jgi:hypothetical protein